MKLLIDEVIESTELYQVIETTEDLDVTNIRPHIYIHSGAVTGNITMRIDDENGNQIASSDTVAIDDMRDAFSSINDYAHGYYKFDLSARLRTGVTYRVVLANSSYTFSESSYCGWCRDFDLRRNPATYDPNVGYNSAFDYELWIKRKV